MFFKTIPQVFVEDTDVGPFHPQGFGLEDACAFKLTQGIHDDAARNTRLVGNLTGHQKTFIPRQSLQDSEMASSSL